MKKVLCISSLVVSLSISAFVSCGKQGDQGPKGRDGKDGSVGLQGIPGSNGVSGSNCSVANVAPGPLAANGGALITCGADSVLVTNGATGPQGVAGPVTSYGIVDIVDPCGDAPGVTDEVFLRLADGTLIWSFSDNVNGYNTRLAQSYDGSFQTTDGSGCSFSISTVGHTRTISWSGGSKSWSI